MNRIDRLQAILTTLQSKRVVKADELATRFDVSLRTIYRDIRSLETGGVPIGAEAGIGYFLTEGYHIPPVMFTHVEARALLLAGKLVEKMTDSETSTNFDSALTKVRSVLDLDKKNDLETLENDIIVNPFLHSETTSPDLQINTLKAALSHSYTISFDYHSKGKGEFTNRTVEPIGLVYYHHAWHLIAFCQLRNDYRDFRLDRISKLTKTENFYSRANHLSIKEYLDNMAKETELQLCVVEIDIDFHKYLDSYKYQMGLIKETIIGEKVEMHFATKSLSYFARWVLMMGGKVKVTSPTELKDQIKQSIQELNTIYNA